MTKFWLGEHYPLGLASPHFEVFDFHILLYDLNSKLIF